MTKYGAIAEAERRVRELGKTYNISRRVKTRDYILRADDRGLPVGHILIATVHSDGTVIEHERE